MTWMQAIGGPRGGEWFDVDPDRESMIVPNMLPVATWTYEGVQVDLNPFAEMPAWRFIYDVRKIIWPGFRFPIRILVAPGVKIDPKLTGYDSSWPNPLVQATCRCPLFLSDSELRRFRESWAWSACHLDHCPVHGRWTFPSTTPMDVSVDARNKWLAGQHAADLWNRYLGRTV